MAGKQAVQRIADLPDSPLAASAHYFAEHLHEARAALAKPDVNALAIVIPHAGTDHDDWRRALARDLAREYTPQRVNVVGGGAEPATEALLTYLANAPGVTGQYCPVHD
ncbi:MAG: Rossmann fold domain-containing protein [Pseudomonadota bacterium]